MKFSEISEADIVQFAQLAFVSSEWITTPVTVNYHPYIEEHYSDAIEYWEASFEGYFAGTQTASYRVTIFTSRDIIIRYCFKNSGWTTLLVSNQMKIQELFNEIGYFPD